MFRNNLLNEYQLDPAYFVSAPQLAWNALLKNINQSIPLITDFEMYRMIQPNIRGGICHVSVRYARANNKLMGSLYVPTKPTSYIMEVDANNLHGWAILQEMPDGKFEWVSVDESRAMELKFNFGDGCIVILDLGLFDNRVLDEKNNFILEVDLEYLPELHERDDDYTLAPQFMTIEPEINYEKQHNVRALYFSAACPFSHKLICSLFPKKH